MNVLDLLCDAPINGMINTGDLDVQVSFDGEF